MSIAWHESLCVMLQCALNPCCGGAGTGAGADRALRAYLPNLDYGVAAGAGEADEQGPGAADVAASAGRGLALVALRDVRDEEILLNYR